MNNKKNIFCLIIFIIFCKNNITVCSFFPSVNIEWKKENNQKIQKKLDIIPTPKDIENLILKSCDFDRLINLSQVNRLAKDSIGSFFYENLADVYKMFKAKAKTHVKSWQTEMIKRSQNRSTKEIEEYVEEKFEEFYTIDFSILKNNFAMVLTGQKYLMDDWSPLGALTWSSRHVRIDPFKYFMLPYVQWAETVKFCDFSINKEYIQRLQINIRLKNLEVNCPKNNMFPDLSSCTSLTTITINDFDEKKHALTDTLETLKNIPHLTCLNLSRINIGYIKNSINILSQYPKLEILKVKNIVKFKYKPEYSNSDEIKKYKKFKEKMMLHLAYFNKFSSLKELEIKDSSDYFLKFCLYYYKLKNEIPPVLIPYLEKAFNKYKNKIPEELFWDEDPDEHHEEITGYVFSVPYDYFSIKSCQDYTYPLAKKQGHFEKTIQKIIWKEIGNEHDIQKLQEIITTSDCPIYFELCNQKNIEKQLELLHHAEIDHKKIVGMFIEVTDPIRFNTQYLSKYENLYLSLRIKRKKNNKKANKIFFNFSQNEFPTIAYVNTNDHMLFLQDQSQFPSLKQFIYNNIKNSKYDFKNFRWEHSRLRQEHARMIVFKSFEHKNALIWRNEFENSTRGFGGHSILAPHQNFIKMLFETRTTITNEKIIQLLESIAITYDELKSLEILLQYSYHEIPSILQKILKFQGNINNEEDWKTVQEKYLPVIQEQIELKKSKIKTLMKNIFSIFFPNANNTWKYMFFVLSLLCVGLLFYIKNLIIDHDEKIKNYEELFMEILNKNKSTGDINTNHE